MAVAREAPSNRLPDMPHVDGVTHRDVVANGVRLHVAEAGDPQAPPIVMLHGWPQHWWEWRELIPPLAADHRVICPDLRGFGWSEAPDGAYNPELFAADLLALLDALGLDRVKIIAHDWGGLAAFILCLRHPERVERYLALNIIHPFLRLSPGLALKGTWRQWYQAAMGVPVLSPLLIPPLLPFIDRRIRATTPNAECWDGGVLETFTGRMREHERAVAASRLYRWSLAGGVMSIALGKYRGMRLHTPTLLLFGTEDFAITPAALAGFEQHADDMSLELVPGTGHYIVDERPELVLERARAFLL